MATESKDTTTTRPGFFGRHDNPFLYIANLIGFLRVAGVVYAFAVADASVYKCLLVYFLSFACDALDGHAARAFNQTSRLGAVLDMATDRVATAGLLALLCKFAPKYSLVWVCLIMLDVASHWFQMYVTLACGDTTHKEARSKNPLVSFYYSQRWFMGVCCVSCEVLYLAIYAACHPLAPKATFQAPQLLLSVTRWVTGCSGAKYADFVPSAMIAIALIGCVTKQVVNVHQLVGAMQRLATLERKQE